MSSKKRIFIVDDEKDLTDLLRYQLKREGFKAEAVNDPFAALSSARGFGPDLIVLDVMMPDMDGYDLFREVNGQPGSVPVVLMTAYYYDKDHVIKRSKTDGLDDVIFKKPIDPERLLDLIEARVGG